MVMAVTWSTNSFDQGGGELGKTLALLKSAEPACTSTPIGASWAMHREWSTERWQRAESHADRSGGQPILKVRTSPAGVILDAICTSASASTRWARSLTAWPHMV